MLFGKKEFCPLCRQKIGFLKNRTCDGVAICMNCSMYLDVDLDLIKVRPLSDVVERASQRARNKDLFDSFKVSREVQAAGMFFREDEKQKVWYVSRERKPANPTLYRYDEIVSFELKENGNAITSGGLGRAVVGAVLFGGAGAVVGAVTGGKTTKQKLTSIDISITLSNPWRNLIEVNFLRNGDTCRSGGFFHGVHMQEAKALLAFLASMTGRVKDSQPVSAPVSAADEILKFKELMDKGIITEAEFLKKKQELLES